MISVTASRSVNSLRLNFSTLAQFLCNRHHILKIKFISACETGSDRPQRKGSEKTYPFVFSVDLRSHIINENRAVRKDGKPVTVVNAPWKEGSCKILSHNQVIKAGTWHIHKFHM